MISLFHSLNIIKIALKLSFIWVLFSNTAFAGICDILGSSGIGGTGAPMHGSGIGGTGAVALGNGIGGTGKPISKTGSGIGGTGFVINGNGIGGTGQAVSQNGLVIGTITGFGSICVNGIEIHYSSDTPLQRAGQNASPENAFAIGQVVAVGVSGFGNEVTAKEMHIIHAATGPISAIDFVKGQIEVLGQKVNFAINTIPSNDLNNLQIGDYIEVSGLRDSVGNIMASRIDTIPKQETASLYGKISSISSNSFYIQGLKVHSPAPAGMSIGQALHVTGKVGLDGFKADGININHQPEISADIGGLVSVEGYLDSLGNSDQIEVAGRTIDIPRELRDQVEHVADHERVIVTGRLAEGSIIQMEYMLINFPIAAIEDAMHSTEVNADKDDDRKNHKAIEEHEAEKNEDNAPQKIESHENKEHDEDELELQPRSEQGMSGIEEHKAPEFETLEQSEHEMPETPEFESPEVPEVEVPEAPEFETPEVPEFEAPEVPEFEAPEVPEFEVPELPEFEVPEVPEFEAPEIPEFETPD